MCLQVMYGIMNLLSFWSLKRLPAVLAIVIIQLKLVWTAIFSRIFMKRPLLTPRSFSLTALVFSCISITQYERLRADGRFSDDSDSAEHQREVNLLAAGALVTETMLSGLVSVYMQGIFEMHAAIMWRRNVQVRKTASGCKRSVGVPDLGGRTSN